jgi:hypothetical protein
MAELPQHMRLAEAKVCVEHVLRVEAALWGELMPRKLRARLNLKAAPVLQPTIVLPHDLFMSFTLPLLPLGFFSLPSQAALLFTAPLLLSACLLFPRRAFALAACIRLKHRSLCCTLQPEQIRVQSSSLTATPLCCVLGRHLKSCTHFGFEK